MRTRRDQKQPQKHKRPDSSSLESSLNSSPSWESDTSDETMEGYNSPQKIHKPRKKKMRFSRRRDMLPADSDDEDVDVEKRKEIPFSFLWATVREEERKEYKGTGNFNLQCTSKVGQVFQQYRELLRTDSLTQVNAEGSYGFDDGMRARAKAVHSALTVVDLTRHSSEEFDFSADVLECNLCDQKKEDSQEMLDVWQHFSQINLTMPQGQGQPAGISGPNRDAEQNTPSVTSIDQAAPSGPDVAYERSPPLDCSSPATKRFRGDETIAGGSAAGTSSEGAITGPVGIPTPSIFLEPLASKTLYSKTYINAFCCGISFHMMGKNATGLGVFFGNCHPLNTSRAFSPAVSPESSTIQACILAIQIARYHHMGITIDSQEVNDLVMLERNDNPRFHDWNELERLKELMTSFTVDWCYVRKSTKNSGCINAFEMAKRAIDGLE